MKYCIGYDYTYTKKLHIHVYLVCFLFDSADSDREKSSASGTSTPVGSDYTEDKPEKPQVLQEERDRKIGKHALH